MWVILKKTLTLIIGWHTYSSSVSDRILIVTWADLKKWTVFFSKHWRKVKKIISTRQFILFFHFHTVASESIDRPFMITIRILYEIFSNFINAVMTSSYHNYILKIWNDFENECRNYKIFSTSTCTYILQKL